jgi:hypothetical protein
VIAVLKQTSPTADPLAPTPRPQNIVPSARTSAALQSGGRGIGWRMRMDPVASRNN